MLDLIHSFRSSELDFLLGKLTHAGSLYFIVPFSIVLASFLFFYHKILECQLLFLSLFLTVVSSHTIKLIFKRPRPTVHPSLIPIPMDWSFPSAHTAQVAILCFWGILFALKYFPPVLSWTVCIFCIMLAGLVGLSRIYLQVHYPTDVVAGLLLAAVIFWLSHYLVMRP